MLGLFETREVRNLMVKRLVSLATAVIMLCGGLCAKVPVQHKNRLTEGWEYLKGDIGNIWEAVRPVKAGNPESVPLWESVTLPHCFNAEDCVDPDVNYYQGPGWYKTRLDIQNPFGTDGRVMLEFEGAGQKTDVYVYTTKVGSHTGGYDSWNVDITDAVRDFLASKDAQRFGGKVPLSIRCDNTREAEMIPSDLSDFNVYGGLYRYLNLVYLPAVTADRIMIRPTLAADMKKASVKIDASFYNPSDVRTADVTVTVKSPDGRTVATETLGGITPLGEKRLMDFTIPNPQLWDVDDPKLYSCEVTVKADGKEVTSSERFGLRKSEFIEKGPFHLNGRRLLLRGTHRHEDHAGVAAAMTEDMMRREMKMMKEMGVNFIRLGHYQQSETILNLCDSLGILVWEEIPWCRGGVGGERYREQGHRMLANMIEQHFNHPSVIIWGLGNENDWPNDFPEFEQSAVRAFMSDLNTQAHQLDPSRKTAIRRCDFCCDIPDVYSPTIWAGWYKGDFKDYQKYSKEYFDKVKHFLHVEWGGDSHPGRHTEDAEPTKKDWSETYVVKLIDWHLKEQEDMPWLTGTAYWPFKDFSTPVRPDNPVPYVNQKGVTERDLSKKESYYVFQSYWTDKPMVHILGHSLPVRWGDAGEEKEVLVYSNCPEVELFVNDESLGVRKRDTRNYPAAGLRWNVKFRPGRNDVKAVAKAKDKSRHEDSLAWTYQTEKWGTEHHLDVSHHPIDDDTEIIEVTVKDSKGIPCLDSRRFVRFEIAGDGEMIANQGTAGGSSKVEVANGRASIKVRKNKGKSMVAVSSDGLKTEMVDLSRRRTTSQGDPEARLEYTPGDAPDQIAIPLARTIMARYPDYRTAYWKDYTYVQGYMFEAMDRLGKLTGDPAYTAYMKEYIDHFVDDEGNYKGGALTNLDNFMTGSAFCTLYARTGDEKYKKAALQILEGVKTYPSSDGQFWHGNKSPIMWVDGVFMMQMFLIRCAELVGEKEFSLDTACRNIKAAAKHLQRPDGLMIHAWTTEPEKASWANAEGLSPEVWSEGMGWYSLVVPELLAVLPESHPDYKNIKDIYLKMSAGLKQYQDRNTGGWYMVVDKGSNPLNFIDPSGTAMFVYSIQRGIDLGLLKEDEYGPVAKRGYEALKPFVRVNKNGLLDVIGACDGVTIKNDFVTYVTLDKVLNAKEAVAGALWAAVIMEY